MIVIAQFSFLFFLCVCVCVCVCVYRKELTFKEV